MSKATTNVLARDQSNNMHRILIHQLSTTKLTTTKSHLQTKIVNKKIHKINFIYGSGTSWCGKFTGDQQKNGMASSVDLFSLSLSTLPNPQ